LAGFRFTGNCQDKSWSDVASTNVFGLRQPGGDHATFNQDVPGSIDITIVGDTTLSAGPRPDIERFLA
jgi:hypothetical protein